MYRGLDSILIFMKHFLFVLKISKTLGFFLRTSGENGKKKTKFLDIFNTDKKCFMDISIKTSPPEI